MESRYKPRQHLQLQDLPQDVLLLVFELLDLPTLIRCNMLCLAFHRFIETSSNLQYQISLLSSGVVESSIELRALPLPDRFAYLNAYQDAWNEMSWKQVMHITNENKSGFQLKNGLLTIQPLLRRIQHYWIPSTFKQDAHPYRPPNMDVIQATTVEPRVTTLQEEAWSYAMDPKQDLLVTVGPPANIGIGGPPRRYAIGPRRLRAIGIVSFRNISTGEQHFLARQQPYIVWSEFRDHLSPSCSIKTCGDQVGLLHKSSRSSNQNPLSRNNLLNIFPWKDEAPATQNKTKILVGPIHDFIFLDEDIVLLAVFEHGSPPRLVTIDLNMVPAETEGFVDVYATYLHTFSLQTALQYQEGLRIRFLPNDVRQGDVFATSASWERQAEKRPPFLPSTKDSLLVIRITGLDEKPRAVTYVVVRLARMFSADANGFLDFRRTVTRGSQNSFQKAFYDWNEWSQEVAVCTLLKSVKVATYGLRMLLLSGHLRFCFLCNFHKPTVRTMEQQFAALGVLQEFYPTDMQDFGTYGRPGIFPSADILDAYGQQSLAMFPRRYTPCVRKRIPTHSFGAIRGEVTDVLLGEDGFVCQMDNKNYFIFSF